MNLVKKEVLPGPNIYCHRSVIVIYMDLEEWEDKLSHEVSGFSEDLMNIMPTLKEHYCSRGRSGGFEERLREGTMFGHIIEHVALELQALLGEPVFYGQTRKINSHYRVVFEYRVEAVGFWAAEMAIKIVKGILQGAKPDLKKIIEEGQEVLGKKGLGPSTFAILEAAREKEIPVIPLLKDGATFQLGYGEKGRRLRASLLDSTSCLGVDLACNKWETRMLLEEQGLPFPQGRLVQKLEQARKAAREIGFPLITKPVNASQGRGVIINIKNEKELEGAFFLSQQYGPNLIV